MEIESFNFNQICRTCKCVTPHMRSLFEGYENPHQSPRIDEMLMACSSVQVMCGDGLPTLICQICVEQLKNAFIFKRQAEKVDIGLREYAKNLKVNEIKEELQNSDFMESLNTLNNLLNEQSTSKETTQDGQIAPIAPKIETDYIQFMDNNQMLLTCRECAKMFTTLEGLRCHKRIHSGSMYKCKQCDKEYTRLNHLQRHEQSHNRRKVHVCRICSKTLTRMEHLKRHLVTHLREKPFSCKTCNRGFNRVEHLHNHTPRCKGDTVYPCDICNKAFNREDSLEVHKKMHDNQSPKLPTIENLDNIEDHYYQIDQDINATFSDHDDDVDDCFEPQVDVMEEEEKVKLNEVSVISNPDEESNASDGSVGGGDVDNEMENEVEHEVEDDINEDNDSIVDNKDMNELGEIIGTEEVDEGKDFKVEVPIVESAEPEEEDELLKEAIAEVEAAEAADDESEKDSDDSDYMPLKSSPKMKRGRGRPRKNPEGPPRKQRKMKSQKAPKVPGRGRGRPPSKMHIKVEREPPEEEYGEFPCPVCQEMFHTLMRLDKHARMMHEGVKMPVSRIRKNERVKWSLEVLNKAKQLYEQGISIRTVAKRCGIPHSTLRNRVKKNNYAAPTLGRKNVFTREQEVEMSLQIKYLASIFYGCRDEEIRRIAFEFAEKYGLKHNFNRQKKMAGRDWIVGFLHRNEITVRKAKASSSNKATAFNMTEVETFFKLLRQVMKKYNFSSRNIYNVDEAGICTVQGPGNVLVSKGRTTVGWTTSWERGRNITAVCAMNAAGGFIPPMFIFPGQRHSPLLEKDGPLGATYKCSKDGCITEELFVEWLHHFVGHANPSESEKILLILDNHTSHISLAAYEYCEENHIVMLSVPPHTSLRTQPLDVALYGPLEANYRNECDLYMKSHPAEKISHYVVASLFRKAFEKVASVGKGVSGFKSTGIYPLDPSVFLAAEALNAREDAIVSGDVEMIK